MFANITPFDFKKDQFIWLDFSAKNKDISPQLAENVETFNTYIFHELAKSKVKTGIGGWLENRIIYQSKDHFQAGKSRNIHLGVDIWAEASTPLFAPENCLVHSFQNNNNPGDYGPTIILKSINSEIFYLFGHLTATSLQNIYKGKAILAGENFAQIGPFPENGNWPPHLHFQVMNTMLEKKGDFPGVCAEDDLKFYQSICLNPYDFLNL